MSEGHVHRIVNRLDTTVSCPTCLAREARVDAAEDFRVNMAHRAFTAPDADWDTILTSLDARMADREARVKELEEALREAKKAVADLWELVPDMPTSLERRVRQVLSEGE